MLEEVVNYDIPHVGSVMASLQNTPYFRLFSAQLQKSS